jgi:uncharacterized membrane protein
VLAVGVVFIIISAIFILIRLVTGYKYTGRLAIDDCKSPFILQNDIQILK